MAQHLDSRCVLLIGSQHLWCRGSQPKRVSNADSVTKNCESHFIYGRFFQASSILARGFTYLNLIGSPPQSFTNWERYDAHDPLRTNGQDPGPEGGQIIVKNANLDWGGLNSGDGDAYVCACMPW